jgi:hypothetical protein
LRGGIAQSPGIIGLTTSTLCEVLESALEAKGIFYNYLFVVHRIWIVKGIQKHDRIPVGVVSFTDMIMAIWRIIGDLNK